MANVGSYNNVVLKNFTSGVDGFVKRGISNNWSHYSSFMFVVNVSGRCLKAEWFT